MRLGMVDSAPTPTARATSALPTFLNKTPWHRIVLAAILAAASVLNFLHIDQQGFGNAYYAAAVRSMLESWHNFLFVSFDPGGFVAVDKPPVGFWIQTASAWLFGFQGWSILLPQALAGVLSVV